MAWNDFFKSFRHPNPVTEPIPKETASKKIQKIALEDLKNAQWKVYDAIEKINQVNGLEEYIGTITTKPYDAVFENLRDTILLLAEEVEVEENKVPETQPVVEQQPVIPTIETTPVENPVLPQPEPTEEIEHHIFAYNDSLSTVQEEPKHHIFAYDDSLSTVEDEIIPQKVEPKPIEFAPEMSLPEMEVEEEQPEEPVIVSTFDTNNLMNPDYLAQLDQLDLQASIDQIMRKNQMEPISQEEESHPIMEGLSSALESGWGIGEDQ